MARRKKKEQETQDELVQSQEVEDQKPDEEGQDDTLRDDGVQDTVSLDEVADVLKEERITTDQDDLLRNQIDLESRPDAQVDSGKTKTLEWGSRSDVGLIRDHNEDSFLCRPPLFAVSDGMGGHAAGEVASSIAIKVLTKEAPETADSVALARAIESANMEVIKAPASGTGTPGMGCTLTAVVVDHDKLACAHVGDSRLYILHEGMLVRVTHDHSYVEELVDQGVITTDEAREHPKRSSITRALGSDPNMYADNFTVGIEPGDRIILCSDGLSSMMSDAALEEICVSSVNPQECADALVSAALVAGGQDNVTVVVFDILTDDKDTIAKKLRRKNVLITLAISICLLAGLLILGNTLYSNSYYLAPVGNNIGIYQGWNADFFGMPMYHLVLDTGVDLQSLEQGSQQSIKDGVFVSSQEAAQKAVESIQQQNEQNKQAAEAAQQDQGEVAVDINVDPEAPEASAAPEAQGSSDQASAGDAAGGEQQ